MGMWSHNYAMGWSMWLAMILGIVALWVIVALLVRQSFNDIRRGAFPPRSDALADLDARLARGDITREDYAAARRLTSDGK